MKKPIKIIIYMRIFLSIIFLIFSLQSWTKADDIRDFEIEGMSIGDSALDFFAETTIMSTAKAATDIIAQLIRAAIVKYTFFMIISLICLLILRN